MHPNLLPLMGFCIEPPVLVSPFMERGSLYLNLHKWKVSANGTIIMTLLLRCNMVVIFLTASHRAEGMYNTIYDIIIQVIPLILTLVLTTAQDTLSFPTEKRMARDLCYSCSPSVGRALPPRITSNYRPNFCTDAFPIQIHL